MQLVVSKKTERILCTYHDKGKVHDFKVYKKSRLAIHKKTEATLDLGYHGIEKLHANSRLPKKGSKHKPLTDKDRAANKKLSKERVAVEHVIGRIKVFRIMTERYRNRRQKHTMRVKLICGIYNFELN